MTSKYFAFSLLVALLAFSSCKKDEGTTPDPTPTAKEITPGVGITEVKIGDAAQVAIDLYGVPFPSYGSANGVYTHFLVYASKGVAVYCVPTTESTFNAQMKIASLTLSAPFDGKTAKGIGIGSTKAAVKAAYGDPSSSSAFFGDTYDIGITFVYDDTTDKVESIDVE